MVTGGEGGVHKFLNKNGGKDMECVRKSMRRVGTAPLPQKLRGEMVNGQGVGTSRTDMKIMTAGSTLLDTTNIINILETDVATTMDIMGIDGNKTNNDILYVGGLTANNVQAQICETNLCEPMSGMDSGVGIAVTLTTGLANVTDNANIYI